MDLHARVTGREVSDDVAPPLEYTDSHRPMGVSSIDGSVSEPMLDAEQRKTYFAEPEPEERGRTKEMGKEQRKEPAKEKQ
jgi:hypothetical protein